MAVIPKGYDDPTANIAIANVMRQEKLKQLKQEQEEKKGYEPSAKKKRREKQTKNKYSTEA